MKTKTLISLLAWLGLLSTLNPQLSAAPLGTAFTYQGRLADSGNPANSSYDLRFTLSAVGTGVTAVAGLLLNELVGFSSELLHWNQ